MVGEVGFEPTANSLKGYCSTAELLTHLTPRDFLVKKSKRQGFLIVISKKTRQNKDDSRKRKKERIILNEESNKMASFSNRFHGIDAQKISRNHDRMPRQNDKNGRE